MTVEILSIGEKIKRSRIYKGLTLKDICEDKISVSKMSCIENNKVEPERWILDYISEKLQLDIKYLLHGVKDQLVDNIKKFKKCKENNEFYNEYFEDVLYNLEYAEKYKAYDLCCEIMHLLFSSYMFKRKFDELRTIIPRYYDLCKKGNEEFYQLRYYIDIATYLALNGERTQAISYYNSARNRLIELDLEDKTELIRATYNEASTYLMLEDYENVTKICSELKGLVPYCENETFKGTIFQLFGLLALHMKNYKEFEEYKEEVYKYQKDTPERYSTSLHNFGEILLKNKEYEKGKECIVESLKICPEDNKEKKCLLLVATIEVLIKNNLLELAQEVSDELLNYAINLNSSNFIESAYYYKAILLQIQGNYAMSETYMNLSLDVLLKCGSNNKLYKRYLEMGNMYHKLGDVSESIKFFNLALQLEKKI